MVKIRVCVLMSTYNGEKYLIEQLESILQQKDVEVDILVRDDGSNDRTLDILMEYKALGKIKIISDNENLGPACSFMRLLYVAEEYEYYAFSDQDDIWEKEKLINGIKMMRSNSGDVPTLYCSNQTIYLEDKEVGLRFLEEPSYSLVNLLCGNELSGCTMIINYTLKEILTDVHTRPKDELLRIRMHDVWVLLICKLKGNVIYDKHSYIKYRIHESNTVGIHSGSIVNKVKKLKKMLGNSELRNGRQKTAKELLDRVCDLNDEDKEILCQFANYQNSWKDRKQLINNKQIKAECKEKRWLFIVKVLLNWI